MGGGDVQQGRLMVKGDMGLQKLIVIRCMRCITIMYIYKLNQERIMYGNDGQRAEGGRSVKRPRR